MPGVLRTFFIPPRSTTDFFPPLMFSSQTVFSRSLLSPGSLTRLGPYSFRLSNFWSGSPADSGSPSCKCSPRLRGSFFRTARFRGSPKMPPSPLVHTFLTYHGSYPSHVGRRLPPFGSCFHLTDMLMCLLFPQSLLSLSFHSTLLSAKFRHARGFSLDKSSSPSL